MFHGKSCATTVGGDPIHLDIQALRKWPTAVVGTPGRLIENGRIRCTHGGRPESTFIRSTTIVFRSVIRKIALPQLTGIMDG